MRSRLIVLAVAVVASVVLAIVDQKVRGNDSAAEKPGYVPSPPAIPVSDAKDLQKELAGVVQMLRSRIDTLERRVAELEKPKQVGIYEVPYSSTPSASSYVPGKTSYAAADFPLPNGWQRKEINGTYYYVVPCDRIQAASLPEVPSQQIYSFNTGFPQ